MQIIVLTLVLSKNLLQYLNIRFLTKRRCSEGCEDQARQHPRAQQLKCQVMRKGRAESPLSAQSLHRSEGSAPHRTSLALCCWAAHPQATRSA